MNVNLGFSPCPNDTFIFYALLHQKIETYDLHFTPQIFDVEKLNKDALNNLWHVTKLSYHAYAYVSKNYVLCTSGGALGNACGPLLVYKKNISNIPVKNLRIAIPGKYTTANFLLQFMYPEAKNTIEFLFSDIEEAVLSDKVDVGLIIHENRFTFEQKGLKKMADLGEVWENKTGYPIPLGGIAMQRTLPENIQNQINKAIQKSIEYAYQHPDEVMKYVRCYAQEMDEEVMKKHIELYVNRYSLNVGEEGKKAVQYMYEHLEKNEKISIFNPVFFNES